MNKKIKNILCYSHYDFDNIMRNNGWTDTLPKGVSAISICSPNEGDLAEHWFKHDHKEARENSDYNRVFNLDIDDASPFWFENHESECYDNALELYLDGQVKRSNSYFNHLYISGENKQWVELLHVLDYEEAFNLADWIEWRIKHDDTIYIHCAVGASRSQGVVRYIVDTYKYDYDICLNPNNPNNTYNPHVLMMLKRAYMNSDFYSCITRNDERDYLNYTEPMKFDHNIKLNIL
jgi:hypothetical protein